MSEKESQSPNSVNQGVFSRTFQAFRYRDFRLVWFGAFTSTTGTWMQQVAQSWLVLMLTGSPFYLGLTGFLGQFPHILFSLIGGAYADRVERKKLLIYSQLVQMVCAFVLTGLVFFEWIEIWHFLVIVFITGTAQAFGGPAYQAMLPSLVKREDLSNAIALNSIQFNLARAIGPLVAAVALASVGAVLCFGINGLSFLAVIIALSVIRSTFVPKKTKDSVAAQIGEGFRYMKGQGALWRLTILGFASTFCGVPLLTLLPAFVQDVYGAGEVGYSVMMAISGSGSVVGALLYAAFSKQKRQGLVTMRMQLVISILLAAFALSRNLALTGILLFCAGACLMALFASITSLVQLATDDEMRGRVMSIFYLAFRGGMPLGDLLAGTVASRFSTPTAIVLMAGILGTVAVYFLVTDREIRVL
jgi:predicted MFS family arabinose efflux permease